MTQDLKLRCTIGAKKKRDLDICDIMELLKKWYKISKWDPPLKILLYINNHDQKRERREQRFHVCNDDDIFHRFK